MKINPRCPPSNFGHIIGHPPPPFGPFLGGEQRWRGRGGIEEGSQEEPLSTDPLECFAALLAREERSVELIVVNAADHLKAPANPLLYNRKHLPNNSIGEKVNLYLFHS